MPTLLITGANRGIGLEAAAQLASLGKFDRIILTARTAEKGEAAVKAALAQATLQPGRNFSFAVQVLDLESHASVRAAVKALPKLDAVILNAGGLLGEELTAHGVTQSFAANVLGHAVLLEAPPRGQQDPRRRARHLLALRDDAERLALRRLPALCAAVRKRD